MEAGGVTEEVCNLCPRRCGAKRFVPGGSAGWCGAGAAARVFRWGPHFGEEPPVTGENGSGCIFFSHCTMKCLYCQNSPWSWGGAGEEKTVDELASIMRSLAVEDKTGNWNLVSPTPHLPFIREAAAMLGKEGVALPFVWNSSGYERIETLEEYSSLCDIALFDLRYSRDATAAAASAARDYVATARAAMKWAWERKGPEGLIARILVLPGHPEEAVESLAWIATELSPEVRVSVMAQYTPAYKALENPPFDRPVSPEEYETVAEAAADFGFVNGWTQSLAASDPKLALLGENMASGRGAVR